MIVGKQNSNKTIQFNGNNNQPIGYINKQMRETQTVDKIQENSIFHKLQQDSKETITIMAHASLMTNQ